MLSIFSVKPMKARILLLLQIIIEGFIERKIDTDPSMHQVQERTVQGQALVNIQS